MLRVQSFSCNTITAAIVGGIAGALVLCVLVPCLVWYFYCRKPRLPRTESNVTDMDFIAGGSTRTLPRTSSAQPKLAGQQRQQPSARTPATRNTLSLAEQIAQMAAQQQQAQARAPAPTAPQAAAYPQPVVYPGVHRVQMVPVGGQQQAYYAAQPGGGRAQGGGGGYV